MCPPSAAASQTEGGGLAPCPRASSHFRMRRWPERAACLPTMCLCKSRSGREECPGCFEGLPRCAWPISPLGRAASRRYVFSTARKTTVSCARHRISVSGCFMMPFLVSMHSPSSPQRSHSRGSCVKREPISLILPLGLPRRFAVVSIIAESDRGVVRVVAVLLLRRERNHRKNLSDGVGERSG